MTEPAREKIVPAQLERRVYERLRDDIVSGELQPGAQLVEARIAEELGVSKTPVREALIRLQRDGLVAIEPYRGARVTQPSPEDVREILELRLLLECRIARDLAERRPPEVLRALQLSVDQCLGALAVGDRPTFLDGLTQFSDIQAAACGNRRMAKLLVDLRGVLLLIGSTSLRAPGREHRSLDEHEAILAAITAGNPEAAAAATAAHIRSIEHDTLDPDPTPAPTVEG
jgi:GntR family transcriptional regulator, rspAB operon transcriptional repressor